MPFRIKRLKTPTGTGVKFAAVWDEKTRHNRRDRYNPRQEVWFSQGILMHDAHEASSLEQRRKLLKGALAASSVITMGYSGSALASFECVAKVRETNVAIPGADFQFRMTAPDPASQPEWAWQKVQVRDFVDTTNNPFQGFTLDGTNYFSTVAPHASLGALTPSTATIYDGWVLTYFDDGGSPTATYPTKNLATAGFTPAARSCLASVNPNVTTDPNFYFGG